MNWVKPRRNSSAARAASIPEGTRVYAVGDVHGHLHELEALLEMVAEDLRDFAGISELVFVGDYIDRGPDSRGVVDLFLSEKLPCDRHVFLRGNHEDVLLDILAGTARSPHDWLSFGGYETLASYGVERAEVLKSRSVRAMLSAALPRDHIEFFETLRTRHKVGDYLFVHAGIRPGIPMEEQSDRDVMWIRDAFLDSRKDHGHVVVHGHTIEQGPVDRINRIGIDTGCYAGGALSAVCLEGTGRRFLSVAAMD